MNRPVVLVVEDEPRLTNFLTALLDAHGYAVHTASSGEEAVRQATTRNPEVVLLDLGLPDMDGLDLVVRLRTWMEAPILVVSARGREADKVEALDRGADDYLTKPFGAEELLARIRVALRHHARARGDGSPVVTIGPLRLDLARREVLRDGVRLELTPTEYQLLVVFMTQAGKVLTHPHLLKAVWGPNALRHTHYVRVYVAQLRRKIEEDPADPKLLLTETGVGYRFTDPGAPRPAA